MKRIGLAAAAICCAMGAAAFGQCDDSVTSTFAEGNGHRGAMWDLTCLNPDGITITSFDFNARSGTSGPASIEVWYVTDHTTYVGKNTNQSLWTLLGSANLPNINPTGTPTNVPIGGLTINFGETCGLYFTRTDGVSIGYTNGPLGTFENADVRWEDRGMGGEYPFQVTFNNRVFNGTVYYECGGGGGFRITLTGDCPGRKTLAWSGAGSGQMGILLGNSQGTFTIPGGPCQGTQLGISGGITLYTVIGTMGGEGQVSATVGTGACGKFVQCIKTDDCTTSNVAGPI